MAQQVEHTPRTYRPAAGQAINFKGIPLPAFVCSPLSSRLQNQKANRKAKTRQKEIIQWLLGKKIVNVLVPFTKPQPKKVTYKIPERKQC